MTSKFPARSTIAVALAALFLSGCTTTRNQMFLEADEQAQKHNFESAVSMLEERDEEIYSERDDVLYYLDTGVLHYYAGNYEESRSRLHEAELLIEEYFTKSVSQAAASFTINDRLTDYAGEDFEDIYLNVFRSLSYVREGDLEAALVEVRRFNNKLNLLEDKYRRLAEELENVDEVDDQETGEVEFRTGDSRFHNSALARYLGMVLRRADGDRDGARIEWEGLQDAFRTQGSIYDFENPVSDPSAHSPEGTRLSVIAMTGQSPLKIAQTLWINTQRHRVEIIHAQEDEELGRIPQGYSVIPWPGMEGGLRFKFEVPRMRFRGSEVTGIRVYVDGRELGELALLENMERIAREAFSVKEPMIFVRAAMRTIIKGLAAEYAGEAMMEAGTESGSALGAGLGILGSIATDIAAEVSEQADLRISRYFPAYAHVGEWELAPGEYDIRVEYFDGEQLMHSETFEDTRITEAGPNLVTSHLYR